MQRYIHNTVIGLMPYIDSYHSDQITLYKHVINDEALDYNDCRRCSNKFYRHYIYYVDKMSLDVENTELLNYIKRNIQHLPTHPIDAGGDVRRMAQQYEVETKVFMQELYNRVNKCTDDKSRYYAQYDFDRCLKKILYVTLEDNRPLMFEYMVTKYNINVHTYVLMTTRHKFNNSFNPDIKNYYMDNYMDTMSYYMDIRLVDFSIQWSSTAIMKYLIEECHVDTSDLLLNYVDNYDTIIYLLQHGADPYICDSDGSSFIDRVLHVNYWSVNYNMLKRVLAYLVKNHGFDVTTYKSRIYKISNTTSKINSIIKSE